MKQQPSPADEDTTKIPGSSDEKVRKHPFCDVLAMFIIIRFISFAEYYIEVIFGRIYSVLYDKP